MKGDEKKCPFCAEVIKRESVVCRFCDKTLTAKNKGASGGGFLVAALLLFSIAAYIFWSPYESLHQIRQDLRHGDVDKLDKLIDFSAVREGLKRDFRSTAIGEVEEDPSVKNRLLGLLGLALGAPVVDGVIDYIVSPSGLRQIVSGVVPILSHHRDFDAAQDASLDNGSDATATGAAPSSDDAASQSQLSSKIKSTDCNYEGMNEFVAKITSKSGSTTVLTFSRRGILAWQLTHIKLIPARNFN